MRLPLGIDLAALNMGLRNAESLIDASMSRVQARINRVSGPMIGGTRGGVSGALRTGGNGLVSSLTGMGTLSTGLGIGAAVSGMVLLEQAFARSIRKAKEFQTATLAIAATLGSIGSWQGANGRPLPQSQQAQRNMWEAEKYRQTILTRSAKNILTFDEQLQSFQSGLASGARKGLKPDQIMKLTEQTAIVAKTLGLRGEQISNASRLLMGGGVNVARSTIGRALGISNADISTRSGPQLERFLQSKMKGFDQMQSKFEGSIEGMVSTLEAKIDVLSARAGAKFMQGIAPTLKQIGMLSEPTRDQFDKGAKGEAQFTKSLKSYQQQSKTMDTIVNSAAQGFNGLFQGVKAVVESDSFKTLLDILIRISSVSKQIMLAMIFKGIASAVMGATGALQRFLAVAGVTSAMGGRMGGAMPADLARVALTSSSRGLAGVGTTGAGAALGLAGYGSAMPMLRDPTRAGLRAATVARYLRGNDLALERGGAAGAVGALGYGAANDPSVAGRIGVRGQKAIERAAKAAGRADYFAINKQLPLLAQEEKKLMGSIPYMQRLGMSTATEEARLLAVQNERSALLTTQQSIPNNYLPAVGRFRAVGTNIGARLPMGVMGLMGGQMVKEMGWGNTGTILGSGIQGGSLGYMLGGNRPGFGAAMGVAGGIGSGIASIYQKKSMENLNKQTSPGDIAGMALGGALKWGATGAMIGSMVAPGVGTAIGGGIGAVGGAVLEPFIGSMKKAEEQAKASAEALDEMSKRFPLAKQMSDLKGDLRGVEKKIKEQEALTPPPNYKALGIEKSKETDKFFASPALKKLYAERDSLETKISGVSDKADYKTTNDRRAERIAALQGQIQLYSGSMSQGPSARKKLLGLQRELGMLNVEANIRSIPVAYNDYEAAQKMRGPQREDYTLRKDYEMAADAWKKTPYAKELQRKYAQFQKNPDNKNINYEQWTTNRTENEKTRLQKAAMPGIKSQIASKIELERMDIGYSGQALKALSQGKKTLADYIVYKNQETQKASQYDKGLDDPAFKKYLGAQLQEKKATLKEAYIEKQAALMTNTLDKQKLGLEAKRLGEDVPIKTARLQIEAEQIQLDSAQTNIELAKLQGTGLARIGLNHERLALTGQSLQVQRSSLDLQGEQIGIDRSRTYQAQSRLQQDFPLNYREGQLNLQQAQMSQRNAAGAPALFYGSMGPVSGAAGAIRNYVESEFAQKFDPAEYEEAYRTKLQTEEEQLTVNKELADINTKRAALGLDRIEEDYANALVDVTMKLRGLDVAERQNIIDKKMNTISQKENKLDIIDSQYDVPQYNLQVAGLQLKQRSNALSLTENALAQQRLPEDVAIHQAELGINGKLLDIKGNQLSREAGQMRSGLVDLGLMAPEVRTKFYSDRGLEKNGGVVTGQGIAIGPAGMSKEALAKLSNLPQIEAQGAYASGIPQSSRVGGGGAGANTFNVSLEAPITNTANLDPAALVKGLKAALPAFIGEAALKSSGRPQY